MKTAIFGRSKLGTSLIIYPVVAVSVWALLGLIILNTKPNPISLFIFFGLLTSAIAFSAIPPLAFVDRLFTKGDRLALRRGRRRAWLLGLGVSVLGVLQLFRVASLFHTILVVIILVLVEIYLSW